MKKLITLLPLTMLLLSAVMFYCLAFISDAWSAHVCSFLVLICFLRILYPKIFEGLSFMYNGLGLSIPTNKDESISDDSAKSETQQTGNQDIFLDYRIDRCDRLTLLYFYMLVKSYEKKRPIHIKKIAKELSPVLGDIHGTWRVVSFLRATFFATVGLWDKSELNKSNDTIYVKSLSDLFIKMINEDIERRMSLADRGRLNEWFQKGMETVDEYFDDN